MERFWRTLREGCLDHLGQVGSLDDVNLRLKAFLDRHYHPAPHAGLMGRAPLSVYAPAERATNHVTEAKLREALAVRERRRVRRDTTVSVLGCIYELQQGFLAGKVVDVIYSHLDDPPQPEVEHEDKRYPLCLVDPVGNSQRVRPLRHPHSGGPREPVVFDPSCINATGDDADQEADDENN
jgi:hypothetical protein